MQIMRRLVVLLALITPPAIAEVHLDSAWVRALPPTQPVTAAYLSVMNHGNSAVSVTGARVEGAGRVEIHTSREVDGLMTMEQITSLDIAPGQTVSLEPGGAHLMLFDIDAMPQPGETRSLCLQFASGEEACIGAEVRKTAMTDAHQHH